MKGRVYVAPPGGGAFDRGVTTTRAGDSFGYPETLEGLRPTESTPPCQGVRKWSRVFPPPKVSGGGPTCALLIRSPPPAFG